MSYPAVLVRLDSIEVDHLREMVTDAWLLRAGKRAGRDWLADHPPALEYHSSNGTQPARYYQLLHRAARSHEGLAHDAITARWVRARS